MELILSVLLILCAVPATAQIVGPSSSVSDYASADTRYVNVTGDTMTGALAITDDEFSVGGSTLVVKAGNVGIGKTPLANTSIYTGKPFYVDNNGQSSYLMNSAGSYLGSIYNVSADKWGLGYAGAVNTTPASVINWESNGAVTIPGSSFSVGTSTFVVSAGKVGIGTASPAHSLDIAAPITNIRALNIVGRVGYETAYIQSSNGGAGNDYGLQVNGGSTAADWGLRIKNAANNADYFRVTGAGNVGIGTTAPDTKLHISSSTIKLDGTGSPAAGKALCFTAAKLLGVCTDTPAADGSCTCN